MHDTPQGRAGAPVDATVDTAVAVGVPDADAARVGLQALDDAPLDEHVAIYEDVHRRLQEGLADLDED